YDQAPPRNTNAVLGDSYIIGRRIGRGAMGEVYEAQHVRLPGQFAVKLLLPELQGNQDAFARFCREAEIMSQLRHPNIVQIFDFNVAPDAGPYFVMEFLQGRDLEARLRAGPLPLPAITRVVGAVSSARALAKEPGRRFGGMMELARAFEDAAERTLGTGADAPASLSAAARGARGMPVRLNDAEIDPPPPVRTPAPLVLKPIRRLPAPTP